MEYVQVSGLRMDGRRSEEVRRIRCRLGTVQGCDGCCHLEQGLTSVLVCVHGPREVLSRSDAIHDKAVVRCEASQAAFSTTERRKRRAGDKRAVAISNFIEETFSNVIQTKLFQKSQIDIVVHVLQADGGVLSACVNATTMALAHAGIPMIDFVTSCTVAHLDNTFLLDLNHQEENAGGAELGLTLMPRSSRILTVKMGSSSSRVSSPLLEQLIEEAKIGCQRINKILDNQIREFVSSSVNARKDVE
mmetsp:Transcript_8260/g.13373  ORF Transcript_8260/g.13373 Transcript_8260/m.13373 type:complete len:247 (-) Transcript_8260:662-1402(-)